MPSDVDICNMALRELGDYVITAMTDSSKTGRLCRLFYEPTVQERLRDHPWRFARRRRILSADPTAPDFEWTYRHLLPATCLRVFKVGEEGEVEYTIEGRYLLTDSDAPKVYYVDRVDESEFDPLFVTIVVNRLAARMCMALTDNASLKELLEKVWMTSLNDIKSVDALEAPPEEERDSEWIEARI